MSKKRSKSACPNPLFLKWLEEWRDEAKEKGLNSQWTYQKAVNSLLKYPLPLRSGKDATILENIGGMIAAKLDKALNEHVAAGGDVESVTCYERVGDLYPPLDKKRVEKKKSRQETSTKFDNTTSTNLDDELQRNISRRGKEYLPKRGSGPYALILALYRESQSNAFKGYLTKDELQRKAEPLSEKSFTTADPGSYYTAWSSMSTLINKGFVVKSNSPAKYSLTESGVELGKRLQGESENISSSHKSDISCFSLDDIPGKRSNSLHLENKSSSAEATSLLESLSDNIDKKQPQDKGFLCASLPAKDAVDQPKALRASGKNTENGMSNAGRLIRATSETIPVTLHQAKNTGTAELGFPECNRKIGESASNKTNIRADDSNGDMSPLFSLLPGTFEVIMCVDQCEVAAGSKANSKKMMLDQLKKSGVSMDIRKLQVGDFLWVAREKCLHGGCQRELVLDFIVERKRMDDLAGSIIDGRFKEQKFRLKSCGLKHVIYLIENFGSMQHMVLPEANLRQAFINSQVIDDLFVRKTENTYESATYLARMTTLLKSFYEQKVLSAYPMDYLKKHKTDESYTKIIQRQTQNLFTFSDFDQQTCKNKMLTVREMFAKQLMQLKGVSSEKAAAIVKLYPTPTCLALDFQRCRGDKQNMLAGVEFGRTKRKIGQIISKHIQLLYDSKEPLT